MVRRSTSFPPVVSLLPLASTALPVKKSVRMRVIAPSHLTEMLIGCVGENQILFGTNTEQRASRPAANCMRSSKDRKYRERHQTSGKRNLRTTARKAPSDYSPRRDGFPKGAPACSSDRDITIGFTFGGGLRMVRTCPF